MILLEASFDMIHLFLLLRKRTKGMWVYNWEHHDGHCRLVLLDCSRMMADLFSWDQRICYRIYCRIYFNICYRICYLF